MKISRRYFLGAAAGSAATLWSFRSIGLEARGSSPERAHDCALLDLNAHCILRESLQGYQAALGDKYNHFPEAGLNSKRLCRMAIVPGLGSIDPAMAETLSSLLDAGTHVLLESGAAFLSPSEFTAHQEMLYRYFDIEVGAPVDLWSRKSADDALLRHRAPATAEQKTERSRIHSLRQLLLATTDIGPRLQSSASRVGESGRCNRQGRSITHRVEKAHVRGHADFSRLPAGPGASRGRPPSPVLVAVGYRLMTGRRSDFWLRGKSRRAS